ncbi:LOW QUALITY PROTEIN: hypothetical protein HJC23_007981 [Cyclotella cryptica]|uniref:K Homology domain-containing protein n=1 Tax=Cyclotella cryptica TaxID=29204 RepID=A0ABD3P914_9STRA
MHQSYFLEEVKTSNYGIEFDLLARMNRIILHGPPDKVEQAKADLLNLCGISKSCGLDSKQVSLVVEKTGKTIHGLSQKHAIIMDVSKVGKLINSSGASIKQNSVSNAIADGNGVLLFLYRNTSKDSPTITIKCACSVMEPVKSLIKKKINEFESKIITVSVPVEIIPAVIGKGGTKINSLRQKDRCHSRGRQISSREDLLAMQTQGPLSRSLGVLFGETGKEVMAQVAEFGCNVFSVSNDDSKLIIKGTKEGIAKTSGILKLFLAKNYIVEINVHLEDATLFFIGGAKSVLQNLELKHDVKASFGKDKGSLLLQGEYDSVQCTRKKMESFLYGGEGLAVCKFKVPEDAIGIIVGNGGSNLPKLELDFEGARINVPKDKNVYLRTGRLGEEVQGSIKIRGVNNDVRDAKALLAEHYTGSYSGFIDLDASHTIMKEPSHFERNKLSAGAEVSLDESEFLSESPAKRPVHKALFKSMDDPKKLAEIAAATGALIYLDSNLVSVVVRSDSPEDESTKALELVNARLAESEKVNYVFRLAKSDAWLLPIIIDKGRQSIKKIEAETGCIIDIFKDELSVVVCTESEDAVGLGKDVLESSNKGMCLFKMPDSVIPSFVGKGGVHIKQFSADYDVEIKRLRKHSSTIKITGKKVSIYKAKASHTGLTINVQEQFISAILGKGGETVKAIQKSTGCKIDVDRQNCTVTVREGTESNRQKATAELAAEKEKLRLEHAEIARCSAKLPVESVDPSPNQVRPVGLATSKSRLNSYAIEVSETATKEGRDLYLMLISGNETTDDQDNQWDSSTVSSSAAMISACNSNDGESDFHYHSISGFAVRI